MHQKKRQIFIGFAVASAIIPCVLIVRAAAADLKWAATNQFGGATVPGFNDEDSIVNGICLDWSSLPDPNLAYQLCTYYGDAEDPQSPDLLEYGALFYVAASDQAQAFDVWVMAVDGSFDGRPPVAGNLVVRMRSFDPQGPPCGGHPACPGDIPAVEIPLVDGSAANASGSNGLFPCWRSARIKLPASIDPGVYWFTVAWSNGAPDGFGMTRETDANAYGLEIWSDGYWTTDPFHDPIIVVSQDPVVIAGNEAPTAVIEADDAGLMFENHEVDGSGSWSDNNRNEPGDSIASYAWSFDSRPEGSNAVFDDATAAATSFTPDVSGDYIVRLLVTDSFGLSDSETLTIHVAATDPPTVTLTDMSPSAVHAEDTTTSINFSAEVTDPDPQAVFEYAWTAHRLDNGAEATFANTLSASATLGAIGLGDRGRWEETQYRITLRVTNTHTGLSATSHSVTLWMSRWPRVRFRAGLANWDVAGSFTFEIPVTVIVEAQRVGLSAPSASFELARGGGTPVLDTSGMTTVSLLPWGEGTYDNVLTLSDSLVWDPGHCFTPLPLGPPKVTEDMTVAALSMVDSNGFAFTPTSGRVPSLSQLLMPVGVPPYKYLLFYDAYLSLVTGGADTIEATFMLLAPDPTGLTKVIAALMFISQALDMYDWETTCTEAHDDPPGYDFDFIATVSLVVPQVNANAAVSQNAVSTAALGVAEQSLLIREGRTSYNLTFNKLFGAYAQGNTNGVLLQGAQLLRYGAILNRELSTHAANQLAGQAAVGVPDVNEVTSLQQQIAAEGFPPEEIAVLTQLGLSPAQIDVIETRFVGLDPNAIAAGIQGDPEEMLQPFGDFYWNHSYTVMPGGLVVVAVTEPRPDAAVWGTITIDARVVRKVEATVSCLCGPAIVTDVVVDGQQPPLSTAPYPPPPFCPPLPPPPQAVPVPLDTTTLPDGAHTITVTGRDSLTCPPQVDPREHLNTDTITIYVDNTPPTVTITTPDADPIAPGIQIPTGTLITYSAADPEINGYSSGLVDPGEGLRETQFGYGVHNTAVRVADRAGNSAEAPFQVVGPQQPASHQLTCAVIIPSATTALNGPIGPASATEPLVGRIASATYQIEFGWAACATSAALRPADCNGDGRVDLDDVDCFVAVLLGQDADPYRVVRCDANGDGSADGLDVRPFVNNVLGG